MVVVSNDVYLMTLPLLVVVLPTVDRADINAVLGVVVTGAESGLPSDISVLARQPRAIDPSRFSEHPIGTVPLHILKLIGLRLEDELDLCID